LSKDSLEQIRICSGVSDEQRQLRANSRFPSGPFDVAQEEDRKSKCKSKCNSNSNSRFPSGPFGFAQEEDKKSNSNSKCNSNSNGNAVLLSGFSLWFYFSELGIVNMPFLFGLECWG